MVKSDRCAICRILVIVSIVLYFGCMNMPPVLGELDPHGRVLLVYFQGCRIERISEILGDKTATVHSLAAVRLVENGQSHLSSLLKMLSCDNMQLYHPL
ncbi:hypothetical protein [Pantoea sp. R13S299]|uniref:hypothetical protein n=1 Tax=Pantoea sp. R13S299 TaxID=3402751 RepID=UPI003AE93DAC